MVGLVHGAEAILRAKAVSLAKAVYGAEAILRAKAILCSHFFAYLDFFFDTFLDFKANCNSISYLFFKFNFLDSLTTEIHNFLFLVSSFFNLHLFK